MAKHVCKSGTTPFRCPMCRASWIKTDVALALRAAADRKAGYGHYAPKPAPAPMAA